MLTMRTREKREIRTKRNFHVRGIYLFILFCGHKFKIHTMQKALKNTV